MSSVVPHFESLEQQSALQERSGDAILRRLVLVGAVTCGLLATSQAEALAARQQEPIIKLGQVPEGAHIVLGGADDGAVKNNYLERRESVIAAGTELGMRKWRMIVYPNEFLNDRSLNQDPAGIKMYEDGVNAILAAGMEPHLTLACNQKQWQSAEQFADYTVEVMKYFGDRVSSYSICNEPNYQHNEAGGLLPLKGKTVEQSYRLFDQAAYTALKAEAKTQDRAVQVLSFELGAGLKGIDFIKNVLAYCPDVKRIDCSFQTDGIAVHLYQFTSSPRKPSPKGGLEIGSLSSFENIVTQAYLDGNLKLPDGTPEGLRPLTHVTEFGYMRDARGRHAKYNLSERTRRIFARRALAEVCKDPYVASFYWYQMVKSPDFWPGTWETGLLDENMQPTSEYRALQRYIESRPDCFRSTSTPAKVQYPNGSEKDRQQKAAKNRVQSAKTRAVLQRSDTANRQSQARRARRSRNHVVQARAARY